MHAVVFERNGGPEVLDYRSVPDPEPGQGEVLIDVEAVGVNYRDIYEREGGYGSPPPAILGVEGAGRVVPTGERVAWSGVLGSYAERITAPRDRVVSVPSGISSEVAAAAMLQGMTALYLASDSYPVQPGEWVLVHAAAGGVGLLLTQIAKLRGGRVIGTTSSDAKAALVKQVGAEEVIPYEHFSDRVREITAGEGVAAVYDGVGRSTFLAGLGVLHPTGRMILYGSASGEPDALDTALLRAHGSLFVQRPTLTTYTRTPQLLREWASQLFELVQTGRVEVRILARYPLSRARQAHEDLQARKTTGKLILIPQLGEEA
jgi:NADPH2:quinone reductase